MASARHTLNDAGLRALNAVHRLVLRATRERVGYHALGMPVIELHTTGRRSGLRRTVLLTCPLTDGGRFYVVASKNGDDRDPDWYHNLLVDPDVAITHAGVDRPMRARVLTPAEKATRWPRIVSAYRGYARYQRRAGRDIPVVELSPR